MRARRNFAWVLFAVLTVAFGIAVLHLLQVRFLIGDAYAPYSTYRSDPLGARALFDSLALLPDLHLKRNTSAVAALPAQAATIAFLDIGTDTADRMSQDLERLAAGGARVVLAFAPEWPEAESGSPQRRRTTLFARLGAEPARLKTKSQAIRVGLPRQSALHFRSLAGEWRVYRSDGERAVALERPWHAGSVVFLSASWLLSNEALTLGPDAHLISWMLGPHRTVIFDETHLGTEEKGSIAALMRRYGLHGPIAAVIVLATLFIWNRSAVFVPKRDIVRIDSVAGRSASAGLTVLLRRSIAEKDLIDVCIEESRAAGTAPGPLGSAVEELTDRRDPVRAYRQLHRSMEGHIRS